MSKIERKYLAHYFDATFSGDKPEYVRLGAALEEYNEQISPAEQHGPPLFGS